MPLLRRRQVTLLPTPAFDPATEGQDPQVFYLKATGEIFKDYECVAFDPTSWTSSRPFSFSVTPTDPSCSQVLRCSLDVPPHPPIPM